jgi:hypothetical protein
MRSRPFLTPFLLVLIVTALPCLAEDRHLLTGTWSVDVAKLNQSDPPKSVTMVFAEAADGSFTLTFDIVTPDGKNIHAGGSRAKADGSLIHVSGSDELDVATFAMPNRRILVMGAALAGRPSHTRVWSLSDDGTYMTETIVGYIDGATPHIRTAIWKRVKPG